MPRWKRAKPLPASVVRDLAETNVGLAAKRQPLAQAIADIAHQQEQVNERLVAVRKQYEDITAQVKAAGNTNVTNGSRLCSCGRSGKTLPSLREYVRNTELQQTLQNEIELTLLKLTDDRLR